MKIIFDVFDRYMMLVCFETVSLVTCSNFFNKYKYIKVSFCILLLFQAYNFKKKFQEHFV